MRDARRLTDVLFAHEPFKQRRDDFNIWGLCPPSPESGVSRPSTGIHRRSPVGATYDAFGSERYVLTFDNRAWREIASWAPYEFVEILANNETYGGGGIYDLYATVAVDSDWADYVFIHEFGHHFAGLADEYYTSPVAYEPPATVVEPWEPNVTALLDPAHLKWADLVAPGTPLPTPWPKDEFEAYSAGHPGARERRSAPRTSPSPRCRRAVPGGAAHEGALFSRGQVRRRGRRVPGRELRRQGLLSAADRLHHVHPRPGALLRRLPAGARADHRPVRAGSAPSVGGFSFRSMGPNPRQDAPCPTST